MEGKFDEETKLATKLYQFTKNLEPGRPAEIWYQTLPNDHKTNWDNLYNAFKLKWPLPTIVEPSREELLEKLNQTKLEIEDIGVMIERDGDKVYTHVVWAEQVKALVNVLDDTKGHLIPQVRRGLPLPIRLTLPTNLATWDTFLAAITSVSMDRLADQQENTETIHNNILQTMGTSGQQHKLNTLTSKFATTSLYPPIRQTPYYTPKTPAILPATTSLPSNTNRQTYTPPLAQQWTPRAPSTPTTQRFNQPKTHRPARSYQ